MRRLFFHTIFFTGLSLIQFCTAAQHAVDDGPTMGELAILQACKQGDAEHLRLLAGQEKINPNFQEPGTGRTPFSIALQHNPQTAKVLLTLGARPHLFLPRTRSIYSESFERADERAVTFLASQGIAYVAKTKKHNKRLCQKLDLNRLLAAGNITNLRTACKAGIIPSHIITSAALDDACKTAQTNPIFAHQALSLLLWHGSDTHRGGKIKRHTPSS